VVAGVLLGLQAQGCAPPSDPQIDDQSFDDFETDQFQVREAAAAPQKKEIADVLQSENAAIVVVATLQIAAPKLADACDACT